MKIDKIFYKKILDNMHDGICFINKDRKILYWNKGAEKLTGCSSNEVIGRLCSDNILTPIDNKGKNLCNVKCPLNKTIENGAIYEEEIYVLHKNGHRIPVLLRMIPIKNSKNEIIGTTMVFFDNSTKIVTLEKIKKLKKQARIDRLTGLRNRYHTEMSLRTRIKEIRKSGWSSGILFIDIDKFKNINDTYGHYIGDRVLKMVSKTLSMNLRKYDFVGRWGGEEFVAIVVNVDSRGLYYIAKKLHLLTAKSGFPVGQEKIQVTISIGATLAKPEDTVSTLIKRADNLMYQSKRLGKNRISTDFKNEQLACRVV